MTFNHRTLYVAAALLYALLSTSALAAIDPISLQTPNFVTLDAPDVNVALDGSSATFNESGFATFLRLTNDPLLGDPNVILPALGEALRFDYNFVEAADGDDAFSVFLFDANLGIINGILSTFQLTASASGSHSFDLSPFVGTMLGLEFELAELDPLNGTLGSSTSVGNLAIVPVPAAVWCLLSGLGALLARRGRSTSS